jgi:type VI secretion system protein ImpF
VADPSPTERLQPSLLDRLTDDAPTVLTEPREARVLTKGQLRTAVLRDLADVHDLEEGIRSAILRFEPRVLPNTLLVEAMATDNGLGWHNVVSVRISAQVWAQPVPLELLLRTEVDLETGPVALAELAA